METCRGTPDSVVKNAYGLLIHPVEETINTLKPESSGAEINSSTPRPIEIQQFFNQEGDNNPAQVNIVDGEGNVIGTYSPPYQQELDDLLNQ